MLFEFLRIIFIYAVLKRDIEEAINIPTEKFQKSPTNRAKKWIFFHCYIEENAGIFMNSLIKLDEIIS